MASKKPKAARRRKAAPPKRKAAVGRPSVFSTELAAAICERMAEGESLRAICRDRTMPHRNTVLNWLADKSDFLGQYARAREAQADVLAEQILEIIDRATVKTVNVARLKFEGRRWLASKIAPKKYGTKVEAEISGKDGGPIQHVDLSRLSDKQLDTLEEILSVGTVAANREG